MTNKKRNGFASGFGFILAAAGSAIGLGNLWSFPYKTSANGGAAFVFTYIIAVIVLGTIVMAAEMYIGKRSQANAITSLKNINSKLGWLGLLGILIPFLITCYYTIIGGFTIKYAVNSFNNNSEILVSFATNKGEVILFTAIFFLLVLLVIMGGVEKGIEKVSKVLMPALFIIVVGVAIYALTLGEGVKEGLEYYLKPDFSNFDFKGVLAAMSQAFYSLSLGMGIMITYGSYADEKIDIKKSVVLICVFDSLVALIGGLAIFPSIYHYKAVLGGDLTISGVLLLFQSMPLVFDSLGLIGHIVSLFFFAMVAIAALTSVISLCEVVTQFVIQKFHISRKLSISIVAIIAFAISIPISISFGYYRAGIDKMTIFGFDWFSFVDVFANNVLLPICALGSCVALGWFLGKKNTFKDWFSIKCERDILTKDGLSLGKLDCFFALMLKYVAPTLILIVEVIGLVDLVKSYGANGIKLIVFSVILIAICIAIYALFLEKTETGKNSDEFEIK